MVPCQPYLHHILSDLQSGFWPGHGCMTATMNVLDYIITALDSKLVSVAVFIHLAKAFDSVDHRILLHRLSSIGLSTTCCDWCASFLLTVSSSLKTSCQNHLPYPKVSLTAPSWAQPYSPSTLMMQTKLLADPFVCRLAWLWIMSIPTNVQASGGIHLCLSLHILTTFSEKSKPDQLSSSAIKLPSLTLPTLVKMTVLPILDYGDIINKLASSTAFKKLDAPLCHQHTLPHSSLRSL